jgi:hypothetical protein
MGRDAEHSVPAFEESGRGQIGQGSLHVFSKTYPDASLAVFRGDRVLAISPVRCPGRLKLSQVCSADCLQQREIIFDFRHTGHPG